MSATPIPGVPLSWVRNYWDHTRTRSDPFLLCEQRGQAQARAGVLSQRGENVSSPSIFKGMSSLLFSNLPLGDSFLFCELPSCLDGLLKSGFRPCSLTSLDNTYGQNRSVVHDHNSAPPLSQVIAGGILKMPDRWVLKISVVVSCIQGGAIGLG